MWSEGVKLTEKDELENVDKAVISGTQRVSASFIQVLCTIRYKWIWINNSLCNFFLLYFFVATAVRILQKAGCNHSMPCWGLLTVLPLPLLGSQWILPVHEAVVSSLSGAHRQSRGVGWGTRRNSHTFVFSCSFSLCKGYNYISFR